MLYALARPLLFALDPETAHRLTLKAADAALALGLAGALARAVPAQPVRAMGLEFPNPVGLAAGLDKNGEHIDALAALGFGFLEVGTVTPRPQPGNPRPRLFRIPERQAIINRMGFNNEGVDALIANVRSARRVDHYRNVDKLGKPIDRSEWFLPPQTVNAYYFASLNEIVFPAAYLQAPNFSISADPAVNYGAIGATIGHEIGHGFDDQGRQFDGSGALRDWWTEASAKLYNANAAELVKQYDSYEPIPGVKIKGQLTLGENLGDLGGLEVVERCRAGSSSSSRSP